jgi:hypothetical protein
MKSTNASLVAERLEQIGLRVGGRAEDNPAVTQEHVGVNQAVVNESIPETGRFDADAANRAADRDVFQLGGHRRNEPVGQRRIDDRLERRESLDVERARERIDGNHPVEVAQVCAANLVLAG